MPTALITGGTSGIGQAAAALLWERGYRVMVTGQNPDTIAAAAKELPEDVVTVRADARSLADADRVADEVRDRSGPVIRSTRATSRRRCGDGIRGARWRSARRPARSRPGGPEAPPRRRPVRKPSPPRATCSGRLSRAAEPALAPAPTWPPAPVRHLNLSRPSLSPWCARVPVLLPSPPGISNTAPGQRTETDSQRPIASDRPRIRSQAHVHPRGVMSPPKPDGDSDETGMGLEVVRDATLGWTPPAGVVA